MSYVATETDFAIVLLADDPVRIAIETPAVRAVGLVRIVGGDLVQDFDLAPAPAGYGWRLGPVGGPWRDVDAGAVTNFAMASAAGSARPAAEAFVAPAGADEDGSAPVILTLAYPSVEIPTVRLDGEFSVTSWWHVGDTATAILPTSPTPGCAIAVVVEYYETADSETPALVLPIWSVVPAAAEDYLVRFVLTATAAGHLPVTLATPRYRILSPGLVSLAETLTPAAGEVQAAMRHPLREFKVDVTFTGNAEGQAVPDAFAHCVVPILALEAWTGQTRTHVSSTGAFAGTRTGAQRLIEFFKYWLAEGRMPAARSAYQAQYEARFVAAAAILRATPSLWGLVSGGLSAVEKQRLDLVMKGLGYSSLFLLSDRNPFVMAGARERSLRGYKAQRGGVPNFSAPVRLTPGIVDGYLRLGGTTLQKCVDDFDRDLFAEEIADVGGMGSLWDTFRQDWTLEVMAAAHPGATLGFGPGPTKAQLHAALREGFDDGVYRCLGETQPDGVGLTIAQSNELAQMELARMFNRIVRPGPEANNAGTALPGRETGPGWTTAHGLKVPSTLPGIDATQLRGVLGSVNPDGTTNKAAWENLPNALEIGMANELDTIDGGPDDKTVPSGTNPAVRSCTTYAYNGLGALGSLVAAGLVVGVYDRFDARFAAGTSRRMEVGVTDFLYRTEHGHREYSKGAQEHPNRDWSLTYIEAQNARFDTWSGIWRMVRLACDN